MKFIKENTLPVQEATVRYHAPRAVNIGDIFYKIKAVDFQYFHEPCLVCGDKKELTVNGVTFKCPCCGSAQETIRIHGHVVQRFRVFKISDKVDNSEWKPDNHHTVEFGIYRKTGHGYQFADHSTSSFRSDTMENRLNVSETDDIRTHDLDSYIFDDYRLAVKIADELTAAEVRRLEEYNAVHGSNYKAKFEEEHDRKSS